MKLVDFLKYFDGIKCIGYNQYIVKCPAHNDLKSSLAITEKNNKILMHCFAGCDNKEILNKLGLTLKELFNNEGRKML